MVGHLFDIGIWVAALVVGMCITESFIFVLPKLQLANLTRIGPNTLPLRGAMAGDLVYSNMFCFRGYSLLYIVALLLIGHRVITIGSPGVKGEAVQEAIGVRNMETAGFTSSEGSNKKKTEMAIRKPNRSTNPKMSTLQPKRRSGRLAHLYWKDLSGISSEDDPIILDSDSGDDAEKKGTRIRMIISHDTVQTDQASGEESRIMKNLKKKMHVGVREENQVKSKGKKDGRKGQNADK